MMLATSCTDQDISTVFHITSVGSVGSEPLYANPQIFSKRPHARPPPTKPKPTHLQKATSQLSQPETDLESRVYALPIRPQKDFRKANSSDDIICLGSTSNLPPRQDTALSSTIPQREGLVQQLSRQLSATEAAGENTRNGQSHKKPLAPSTPSKPHRSRQSGREPQTAVNPGLPSQPSKISARDPPALPTALDPPRYENEPASGDTRHKVVDSIAQASSTTKPNRRLQSLRFLSNPPPKPERKTKPLAPPVINSSLSHPQESFTLSEPMSVQQLAENYSGQFPLRIRILQGYEGDTSQPCPSSSNVYNVHFVLHRKVVSIQDSKGDVYSVPLSSPFQFGIMHTRSSGEESATKDSTTGHPPTFEKVSDIIALKKSLPIIVCATKSYEGSNKEASVKENDIFVVLGIHKPKFHGKKSLQVFSVSSKACIRLPLECCGHFSTNPFFVRMHLPEIVGYISNPFPCQAVLFLGSDFESCSEHISDSLLTGSVTLIESKVETSLIVSAVNDSVEEAEHGELPLLGIPLDDYRLQIKVAVIETADCSEYIRESTSRLLETLDLSKVKHYKGPESQAMYNTQSVLYSTFLKGRERFGIEADIPRGAQRSIEQPPMVGNAKSQDDPAPNTSEKYSNDPSPGTSEKYSNDPIPGSGEKYANFQSQVNEPEDYEEMDYQSTPNGSSSPSEPAQSPEPAFTKVHMRTPPPAGSVHSDEKDAHQSSHLGSPSAKGSQATGISSDSPEAEYEYVESSNKVVSSKGVLERDTILTELRELRSAFELMSQRVEALEHQVLGSWPATMDRNHVISGQKPAGI